MVAKTFVYKRQVEYWTSRQIEEFFLNTGFDIVVYPVEQGIERYLPADHIFGVDNALVKLFGILEAITLRATEPSYNAQIPTER